MVVYLLKMVLVEFGKSARNRFDGDANASCQENDS